MHNIVNPLQTLLFDPFDGILTEKARQQLLDDWTGVFRHILLELMPVSVIAGTSIPNWEDRLKNSIRWPGFC